MTGTDVDVNIGNLLADRFRLTRLLGRGGMASVYRADDEALGRSVAIKLFARELADGDDLQRQQGEIQLLAGLAHPALVTLFDASTDENGNAYLVMELVDGTDLHSRLRDGPLRHQEVARIGQNLAEALSYVHAQGIIHRDIKPGNILLPAATVDDTGPNAKLADFGIARIVDGARLTATGKVLGTAGYFSPEQALGEPITPASDIYSLGLVLLECLTGQRAFPGSPIESMTARLARDPDVPAGLGDSWVGLLRGMTSRNADARPTARDVAGVLARLASRPDTTLPYPSVTARTDVYLSAPPAAASEPDATQPHLTGPHHTGPQQTGPHHPTPAAKKAAVRELPHTEHAATQPDARRPQNSGTAASRSPLLRRILLIAVTVAAVVVLAWLAVVAATSMTPSTEDEAPVDYPAVDGTLGTHLEQLQRSVEP